MWRGPDANPGGLGSGRGGAGSTRREAPGGRPRRPTPPCHPPAAGPPTAGGVPGGPTTLVNINTADEATLETLNGVGPVLAAAIIQYRTEHGPFGSIDQLAGGSGIGPATLEDLRSQ